MLIEKRVLECLMQVHSIIQIVKHTFGSITKLDNYKKYRGVDDFLIFSQAKEISVSDISPNMQDA